MTTKGMIERLFKEHYSHLYSLAYTMLKDEEEAHDVVHEVFSNILHTGLHEEYGKGFLIRCVRNQCINLIRRMPRKESIGRRLVIEGYGELTEDEDFEEMLAAIHKMIVYELPEQSSRIMTLRYEEGLSYQTIADRLGISKVAVYRHLRTGIDYLRKNIKRLEN
ncbi:MAG: sigma-70 family RNA polymerase sigma factor [Muribaculaceae bacterium]|nr:sigma-70 family RNA polymerase sigma factor [Muribaculaceae bacterium]